MTLGIYAAAAGITSTDQDTTAQQQADEQQRAQKEEAKHRQAASAKYFQPTHEKNHKQTQKNPNTWQSCKRY